MKFFTIVVYSVILNIFLIPEQAQAISAVSDKEYLLKHSFIEESGLIANKIPYILCLPKNIQNKVSVILLLHGFGSQKNEVGDFYKKLSYKLSRRGIASLRIDFSGWGESRDPMVSSTLDTMLNDAELSYDFLANDNRFNRNKIGICGFSLGAYIGFELAKKEPVVVLVMLSPVGDPPVDFQSLGDLNPANKKFSNKIDLGWRKVTLGKDFFTSIEHSKPIQNLGKVNMPILAIAATDDSSYQYLQILMHASRYKNKIISLENSNHVFGINSKNDQSRYVIDNIVNWISAKMR